ncbi:hypothetical protein ACN6J9_15820 [Carnobacterium maltaromaticum]|uniref:hypothetical protein n=1 Tax=Carnobacterium maltaromaticum TaxID=2751 RepID=UPI003AFAD619
MNRAEKRRLERDANKSQKVYALTQAQIDEIKRDISIQSTNNGGYGFVIDDYNPGYGPDANAGFAERANAYSNGLDGWLVGSCAVNTFLQCYAESNAGVGWRIKSTSQRHAFINCGSEQNVVDQFIFEDGSSNNLLIGAVDFEPVDNGRNTIVRNTGGASQVLNISRLIKSGKNVPLSIGLDAGMMAIGNVPGYAWHDLDAPSTEKSWDMIANSGNLQIRMLEDNGSSPLTVVTFERGGKSLNLAKFTTIVTASQGIGVGNSTPATTLGTVTKRMQVYDINGNSLGFVPIYDSIT